MTRRREKKDNEDSCFRFFLSRKNTKMKTKFKAKSKQSSERERGKLKIRENFFFLRFLYFSVRIKGSLFAFIFYFNFFINIFVCVPLALVL